MVCRASRYCYGPSPFFNFMLVGDTDEQARSAKKEVPVYRPVSHWNTQDDGTIVGEVELPGAAKNDVTLDVKEYRLSVRGVRRKFGEGKRVAQEEGKVKEEKVTAKQDNVVEDVEEKDDIKKGEMKDNKSEEANTVVKKFETFATLPRTADVEHVKAQYSNGILYVTVPKKPDLEPRRIPVDA